MVEGAGGLGGWRKASSRDWSCLQPPKGLIGGRVWEGGVLPRVPAQPSKLNAWGSPCRFYKSATFTWWRARGASADLSSWSRGWFFFTWGACDVHGVGEVAMSLHRGKGCLHGCHVGFTLGRGWSPCKKGLHRKVCASPCKWMFRWAAKALPHVNEVFDATQCLHGVPGIRPS